MKERPILMSAPMVRAILDGRKTQTRRAVVPMPGKQREWLTQQVISKVPHGHMASGGWQMHHPMAGTIQNGVAIEETSPLGWIRCPYGAPGNRLWVKETHAVNVPGCERGLSYRADHQDPKGDGPANPMRWIPSIHMRREYSRLTLEVTSVRVERVQDISEADAIAEGITSVRGPQFDKRHWPDYVALRDATPAGDTPPLGPKPSQVFKALWDDINGGPWKCWDDNPWVWVVGFRRVEP